MATEPPLRGELQGIGYEIGEDLPQAHAVAAERRQLPVDALIEQYARVLRHEAERGRRGAEHLADVDLSRLHRALAALDLGDVEDVVDDGEQVPGCVMDEVGVVGHFGVREAALVLLGKQLGKADDGVERRAQLVAHVGDELGLNLARKFGLNACGMLSYARPMTQYRIAQERGVLVHEGSRFGAGERSAEHCLDKLREFKGDGSRRTIMTG